MDSMALGARTLFGAAMATGSDISNLFKNVQESSENESEEEEDSNAIRRMFCIDLFRYVFYLDCVFILYSGLSFYSDDYLYYYRQDPNGTMPATPYVFLMTDISAVFSVFMFHADGLIYKLYIFIILITIYLICRAFLAPTFLGPTYELMIPFFLGLALAVSIILMVCTGLVHVRADCSSKNESSEHESDVGKANRNSPKQSHHHHRRKQSSNHRRKRNHNHNQTRRSEVPGFEVNICKTPSIKQNVIKKPQESEYTYQWIEKLVTESSMEGNRSAKINTN